MQIMTLPARVDQLDTVLDFMHAQLEAHDCPMKVQLALDIAVEELFVNIAHYAYQPGEGDATIAVAVGGEPRAVTVTLTDGGAPYDPLAREDPDLTASLNERQIGGLGIYMVKQSMDEVAYEYAEGRNRITIRKKF